MFQQFKNPSNEYRPIPFWSWNDRLEIQELEYQIAEMKKARVGGYFMHARSGLKTEYLSEEWFACIKTGIEAGKKTGLHAWAYDEEGWPSGFAGGIVPALSEDYHAKFISMAKHNSTTSIEKDVMLACFLYDEMLQSYKKIEMNCAYTCKQGEIILAIYKYTNPYYIDTMNERAVHAFLECTHDEYYKRFGDDFGTYMKGFFTDEPRLTCDNFLNLAWSDDLPAAFLKTYDYDILEHLPELYMEIGEYEKIRYDFWSLVNLLFVHSFMKTIYDWCEEHHCKLTGHVMMEESIFSQMTSTGGVMPFYEYMHTPGIDWLRRPISSPVIAKQVGSAAYQLGKKQVITETFALSGWDVSFEELKWIAEWQFVNGVNQICQHLESYTIKGVRKRDYPPSLFIQQTWWDEYGMFNDYLGRLCVALTEGEPVADVLLLHPMKSGYVLFNGTRTDKLRLLDDKFTEVSETFSGLHIGYHFGDETIIQKYGDVNGNLFRIGGVYYKVVVLPPMHTIDEKTLRLMLAFIENGGTVLSMGRLPSFTNGNLSDLELLSEKVISANQDTIRAQLEEKRLLALSVAENGKEVKSISYQQRETDNGTILFLVNHNQEETYQTKVTVFGKCCKVKRMIAETGELEELAFEAKKQETTFELTFEPMQSYLVLLEKLEAEETLDQKQELTQEVTLHRKWNIETMDLNSMTLDMCRYRIDDGEWQDPIAVIQLQGILLDFQRPCKVQMAFEFNMKADLSKINELYVVIEDASLYQIQVNGESIANQDMGYWKDKAFKKVNIHNSVIAGKNEILLDTTFKQPQKVYDVLYGENVYETELNKITFDMELESIYLLGNFGVVSEAEFAKGERKALITEGPFSIVDQPVELTNPDFATNGFLFFAGTLEISQELEITQEKDKRVILNYGKQKAPWIKIYVNNEFVKDSLWAPYKVDITDFIRQGKNTIKLKVYSSNRNLLGPHHHIDGECYNVGPDSFTGKWSWVERKSEADATDVFDTDKDYWTDTYCFVEFGLGEL